MAKLERCPKCQEATLKAYDLGKPLLRYICECSFSCLYDLTTGWWWATNPDGSVKKEA